MIRDLFDVFDVLECVVFIDHENRAALDAKVFD